MNPRRAALLMVSGVVEQGRSLATLMPEILARIPESRDRAFARQLAFGVLRFLPRLEACAACHLERPLRRRDRELQLILLLGLYQLIHLRVPDHAAVSETVALARAIGKPWAGRMINAVLRAFLRSAEQTLELVDRDPATACAHPRWMFDMLRHDWPEQWLQLVAANNAQAPMTLRINQRRIGRDAWLRKLRSAGMEGNPSPHVPEGVILERAVEVQELPGFAAGEVSVQDGAAQLAARLLDPRPGERVLDACAAPGGKTAHLLELQPDLAELVALDSDAQRLQLVRQNLTRLALEARLHVGDAADPRQWWDGSRFDRVLLDAPCSASGVIRRHPDIKLLRRESDISALVAKQQQILESLWFLLKPGGILLYATCSVLKRENVQQVADFIDKHPDARELPIAAGWGRATLVGRQILPGEDQMDGFYYARLQKVC